MDGVSGEGFWLLRRLLWGSSEAGAHGVPIRPWVLDRIRDGEAGSEGLTTPKTTATPPPVLLSVCVPKQTVPLVYDVPKSAEGFGA